MALRIRQSELILTVCLLSVLNSPPISVVFPCLVLVARILTMAANCIDWSYFGKSCVHEVQVLQDLILRTQTRTRHFFCNALGEALAACFCMIWDCHYLKVSSKESTQSPRMLENLFRLQPELSSRGKVKRTLKHYLRARNRIDNLALEVPDNLHTQ